MALPGLLSAAWWGRRPLQRFLSVVYAFAGTAAALIILLNSAFYYRAQVAETVERALLRMGLTDKFTTSATLGLSGDVERPGVRDAVIHMVIQHKIALGILGVLAIVAQVFVIARWVRRSRQQRTSATAPVAALFSLWSIWTVVFWFHLYIHDCEFFIAAPAAALSVAYLAKVTAINLQGAWTSRHVTAALLCLLLLLFPVARLIRADWRTHMDPALTEPAPTSDLVVFGEQIRRATPVGSVVLMKERSAVPLFYSQRHLVQGISGQEELVHVAGTLARQFQGCSFFLALKPDQERDFDTIGKSSRAAVRTSGLILYQLSMPLAISGRSTALEQHRSNAMFAHTLQGK
jgi:hypothetical protein